MAHLFHVRQQQPLNVLCRRHQEYVKGICFFNGVCSERLLCRSCRRTHDNNHLNSYESLEDLLSGNLVNDITRDLNQLLKEAEHQNITFQKNNQHAINQIDSLFTQIQNHILQRLVEVRNNLVQSINQKLQDHIKFKDTLIIFRDEIDQAYRVAINSNFQPHHIVEDLVRVLFEAQNYRNDINNDPQARFKQAFDVSLISSALSRGLVQHVKTSLDQICTDIEESLFPPPPAPIPLATPEAMNIESSFNPKPTFVPDEKKSSAPKSILPTTETPLIGRDGYRDGTKSLTNKKTDHFQSTLNRVRFADQAEPPTTSAGDFTFEPDATGQLQGSTSNRHLISDGQSVLGGTEKKSTISPKKKHTPKKLYNMFEQVRMEEQKESYGTSSGSRARRLEDHPNRQGEHRRNNSASDQEREAQSSTNQGASRNTGRSSSLGSVKKGVGRLQERGIVDTNQRQILSGGITYVSFRGGSLVVAGGEGSIDLWSFAQKRIFKTLQRHKVEIFKVICVQEKDVMVSADYDGKVKVWNYKDGYRHMTSFDKHKGPVIALEYLEDQQLMVSGGEDETLRVWKLEDAEEVFTMNTHHRKIGSICDLKKDNRIAVGFDNGNINIMKAAKDNKKLIHTIKKAHSGYILNLAFVKEKNWLIRELMMDS